MGVSVCPVLPESVNEAIDYAEQKTAEYDQYTFTVCFAYGSREEMIAAKKSIAEDHGSGKISIALVLLASFSALIRLKNFFHFAGLT